MIVKCFTVSDLQNCKPENKHQLTNNTPKTHITANEKQTNVFLRKVKSKK